MAEIEILKAGLKQINLSGQVAKGMNCVIKAIIKGKAKLVVLAEDCDVKDYKAVITALCKQYDVKLQSGVAKEDLGAVLGMNRPKGDGSARSHKINCSACAVTKLGKIRTPDVEEFLRAYIPSEAAPAE